MVEHENIQELIDEYEKGISKFEEYDGLNSFEHGAYIALRRAKRDLNRLLNPEDD